MFDGLLAGMGADVTRCALLALALGCASSQSAKLDLREQSDADLALARVDRLEEHKAQGPALDLKFATIAPGQPPAPQDGLPPHGDLLEARIVGPSTDDLVAVARLQAKEHASAAVTAKAEEDKKSAPAAGCMLGLGFWLAIALAGLLAAANVYLRLRR